MGKVGAIQGRQPREGGASQPPEDGLDEGLESEIIIAGQGVPGFSEGCERGHINVLRSMQAKLMTMQGQTGKNSEYSYFA